MAETRKKVLLIDDEGELLEVLTLRLEACDFIVATAQDGPTGLKQAKSFQPDIILLDIMMPKMDGWEVCRRLRADDDFKNTKI